MTGEAENPCESNCIHAVQTRCPHCDREIYAMAVWAFSHGGLTCRCGRVSTAMRYDEWLTTLAETRRLREKR